MRVENADRAIIGRQKIHGYLLSETHPIGRFKAAFFQSLGYSSVGWAGLEASLRLLLLSTEVAIDRQTPYGRKYEFSARLTGPNGRSADVVCVWIVLHGEDFPRFITAYPGTEA